MLPSLSRIAKEKSGDVPKRVKNILSCAGILVAVFVFLGLVFGAEFGSAVAVVRDGQITEVSKHVAFGISPKHYTVVLPPVLDSDIAWYMVVSEGEKNSINVTYQVSREVEEAQLWYESFQKSIRRQTPKGEERHYIEQVLAEVSVAQAAKTTDSEIFRRNVIVEVKKRLLEKGLVVKEVYFSQTYDLTPP